MKTRETNRRAARARRRRGETLIEAMIAMAIFTVGIVGILGMNILASNQNGLARHQTVATLIGRDLVDAFERLPFDSDHPMLAPTGVASDSEDFSTWSAAAHRLAMDPGDGRPLLGASELVALSDGMGATYDVGWHVADALDDNGLLEARHIMIMVRFQIPGGGTKQLNFWTVKPNTAVSLGGTASRMEI